MLSGVVLIGIGMVSMISYQIGRMKGWDEWDEQNQIQSESDSLTEAFKNDI